MFHAIMTILRSYNSLNNSLYMYTESQIWNRAGLQFSQNLNN